MIAKIKAIINLFFYNKKWMLDVHKFIDSERQRTTIMKKTSRKTQTSSSLCSALAAPQTSKKTQKKP